MERINQEKSEKPFKVTSHIWQDILLTLMVQSTWLKVKNPALLLQKKILEKEWMSEDQRKRLIQRTTALVNEKKIKLLKQLDERISFKDGCFRLDMTSYILEFAPNQANYEDIKDISWLEEWVDFYVDREHLFVTWHGLEKILLAGKEIVSAEEVNLFPWYKKLSSKIDDMLYFLGAKQLGFFSGGVRLERNNGASCRLWTSTQKNEKSILCIKAEMIKEHILGSYFYVSTWDPFILINEESKIIPINKSLGLGIRFVKRIKK